MGAITRQRRRARQEESLNTNKEQPKCVVRDRANSGWQMNDDEDEVTVLRPSPLFPMQNSE